MLSSEPTQDEGGWFDSHCHLNHLDALTSHLSVAAENGIRQFLIPSTEREQWPTVQRLATERFHYALGTHPWFVTDAQAEATALENAIGKHLPHAIGEIGLDYYAAKSPRPAPELQRDSFERQLIIAKQHQLPVILHCVKAHQDVIVLLKRSRVTLGVVHAFNGSYPLAKQYLDLGFKLGIGPALLKSPKLQATVQQCGIQHLIVETDAPYLSSEPSAKSPLLALLAVGHCLAQQLSLEADDVRAHTAATARQLFNAPTGVVT